MLNFTNPHFSFKPILNINAAGSDVVKTKRHAVPVVSASSHGPEGEQVEWHVAEVGPDKGTHFHTKFTSFLCEWTFFYSS